MGGRKNRDNTKKEKKKRGIKEEGENRAKKTGSNLFRFLILESINTFHIFSLPVDTCPREEREAR